MAIERRRLDTEHPEHQVQLPAVVDLVFLHRAQPLPGGHRHVARRRAFCGELLRRERTEDRHRFAVQAIHERQHGVAAVGQLAAVRCIAAWTSADGLRPHVAFGGRQVSDEISESKGARLIRPFDLVGRDQQGDPFRALAHAFEVFQEFVQVEHAGPPLEQRRYRVPQRSARDDMYTPRYLDQHIRASSSSLAIALTRVLVSSVPSTG